MAAFKSTVRTAVRGYHIHEEVWAPTVSEEFVGVTITMSKHAVSVHKEGEDVRRHLIHDFFDLSQAIDFCHTGCLSPSDD